MPLYERKCVECDTQFERYIKSFRADGILCNCGGETVMVPSAPALITVQPGKQPVGTTRRPDFKRRAGGGVAALNKATGGYRPALTHMALCPNEQRTRNIAVLGRMPYGYRVECEACGYQWMHNAALGADSLRRGHDSSLRPGKQFGRYTRTADDAEPERGA